VTEVAHARTAKSFCLKKAEAFGVEKGKLPQGGSHDEFQATKAAIFMKGDVCLVAFFVEERGSGWML